MALDLRFAAAQRDQHGKRQQLPRFEIQPVAGVIVAKAVRREKVLNVHLVFGRLLPHFVDRLAEDRLL